MDTATITAISALGGSLVGTFGSSVSTWIAQRHQNRRDLLARKISSREQLYSEFINESAKVMVDAFQHTFQDPAKLIPIYALVSRMHLSSSPDVIECANEVVQAILRTYSEPNLTAEEIQSNADGREDPLRTFSAVCRRELDSLWTGF